MLTHRKYFLFNCNSHNPLVYFKHMKPKLTLLTWWSLCSVTRSSRGNKASLFTSSEV